MTDCDCTDFDPFVCHKETRKGPDAGKYPCACVCHKEIMEEATVH